MKYIKNQSLTLILIVILLLIITVVPLYKALAFEYHDTGKVIAYVPIKVGDHFSIRYIHSIHLTPVLESYVVNHKDHIVQQKETYESFNVGMPSNAEGDEVFTQKGKKYIISNMHREFPYFDLRVGQVVANHTLNFKGKHYLISDYTAKGMWVRVHVRKLNLWQLMKGVNILDGKPNTK